MSRRTEYRPLSAHTAELTYQRDHAPAELTVLLRDRQAGAGVTLQYRNTRFGMTPDQARALADALVDTAELADALNNATTTRETTQ